MKIYIPLRTGQIIRGEVALSLSVEGHDLCPIVSDGGTKRENVYQNLTTILTIGAAPLVIMDSDIIAGSGVVDLLAESLNERYDLSYVWSSQNYGHGIMVLGQKAVDAVKKMHIDITECARCQWLKMLEMNGYKLYLWPGVCQEITI